MKKAKTVVSRFSSPFPAHSVSLTFFVWDKAVNFPGHTGSPPTPSFSHCVLPLLSQLSGSPVACPRFPTQTNDMCQFFTPMCMVHRGVETALLFCSSRVSVAISIPTQRFTREGKTKMVRHTGTF